MSYLDIIILAIIQGLTEFIPVSSSGHLILAEDVFGIDSTLAVDTLLHLGTLLALIIYFRHKLFTIASDFVNRRSDRLVKNLAISTTPAVIIGAALLAFDIDDAFRDSLLVAFMLFMVGFAMVAIDRVQFKKLQIKTLQARDAGIIGLAQVLAFIPGTSRSGITMLAGKSRGLSYRDAAEYSFLMAIPILLISSLGILLEADAREFVTESSGLFIVGTIVSFATGYLAVAGLLRFLSTKGLAPFGYYRMALSLVLLILILTNVI